jgi:hypothetical protein
VSIKARLDEYPQKLRRSRYGVAEYEDGKTVSAGVAVEKETYERSAASCSRLKGSQGIGPALMREIQHATDVAAKERLVTAAAAKKALNVRQTGFEHYL